MEVQEKAAGRRLACRIHVVPGQKGYITDDGHRLLLVRLLLNFFKGMSRTYELGCSRYSAHIYLQEKVETRTFGIGTSD